METLPLDAGIFVTVLVVNNVSAVLVPTKNFTVVVFTCHGLPSATTFLTNEKIVLDGLGSRLLKGGFRDLLNGAASSTPVSTTTVFLRDLFFGEWMDEMDERRSD